MSNEKSCSMPVWFSWVVVIVGVLFVLSDLGILSLNISGWTAAFVLFGIWGIVKNAQ